MTGASSGETPPGGGKQGSACAPKRPGGVETRAAKKRKNTVDTAAATKKGHQNQQQHGEDAFCVLTDDALLTPIFEFVGVYEYRFVAILNKRFQRLYSEFQKNRIRRAPMDSSLIHWYAPEQNRYLYDDFCTSLTLMSSAAYSVDHAKLLMDDITTTRCFYLVTLYKYKGDEAASYGSFYERQNHTYFPYIEIDAIDITRFLRDKVALRYGNLEILQWTQC